MLEQSTISKLWHEQKAKITFISALIPLVSIILMFFVRDDTEALLGLGLAFLAYQVAFLIAIVFDTQNLVAQKTTRRMTKIPENDAFWKHGVHYKTLDLNALNGVKFIEAICDRHITIDAVRIIVPSTAAIKTYFNSDGDVGVFDKTKAAQTLEDSIESLEANLSELIKAGPIGQLSVRRHPTFQLDFCATLDGNSCLVGTYVRAAFQKPGIGLTSLSWIETDWQVISHRTKHFEQLWNSLETPNA